MNTVLQCAVRLVLVLLGVLGYAAERLWSLRSMWDLVGGSEVCYRNGPCLPISHALPGYESGHGCAALSTTWPSRARQPADRGHIGRSASAEPPRSGATMVETASTSRSGPHPPRSNSALVPRKGSDTDPGMAHRV
jgi:hypothetical protein